MSDTPAIQNGDITPDAADWSLEAAAARLAALDATTAVQPDTEQKNATDQEESEQEDLGGIDAALSADDTPALPESESNTQEDALETASEADDSLSALESGALHTITIDGENQDVSLGELKAGYQRNADYTRKTQSVAEERRQLQDERAQYGTLLSTLTQSLATQPVGPPDDALLERDPAEYIRQSQQWHAHHQVAEAAAREQARVAALVEQDEATERAAMTAHQDQQLARTIPGWADPAVRQTGKNEVNSYLATQYGATPDDLAALTDHRLIVLAHKAMQYDKLSSKQSLAHKKVRNVPQVQAPGAAQSRQQVDAATVKALRDQFHKSGSIDDAAKLMRYLGG